jgi:hypothetical protein
MEGSRKRGVNPEDIYEPAPKKTTSFECYLARLTARKVKVKELLEDYNSKHNPEKVNIDRFMKIYDDETIPAMWCEIQSRYRVMEVHPRTKRAIGIKIHALHDIIDVLSLQEQAGTDNPGITEIFRRIAIMIRTSSPAGRYDIINYSHDPTQYEEGDDPALVGWANPPSTGGAKRKSKRNSSKRANKKKKTIKSKSKRRPRTRKY